MVDKQKDITQTAFYSDLTDIFENEIPYKYNYSGIIHTVEDDYDVYKILRIIRTKDYVERISDLIFIEVTMLLGDVVKLIYPERRNLEFTLIKTPFKSEKKLKNIFDKDLKEEKVKYKVIYLDKENRNIMGSEADRLPTYELNQNGYVSIKLQLLERNAEAIRGVTVSGIYKDVKYEDLVTGLFHDRSTKTKVDGKPIVDGLCITEFNNKNKLKHVIIPEGTLVYDLPGYLQKKGQGIYNAGIGVYMDKLDDKWYWYIYTLYNYKEYTKSDKKKIVFFNAPENRTSMHPNTWLVKNDDLLWVAGTGTINIVDDSDTSSMNLGNGFRSVCADSFMTKPVKITEDGPVAERKKLNRQVQISERDDTFVHSPYDDDSNAVITTNPYDDASGVCARNLSVINIQWENSDSSAIEPGMPCLVKYEQGVKLLELRGVIARVDEVTTILGNEYTSSTYKTTAMVSIFAEKYNERNLK